MDGCIVCDLRYGGRASRRDSVCDALMVVTAADEAQDIRDGILLGCKRISRWESQAFKIAASGYSTVAELDGRMVGQDVLDWSVFVPRNRS